MMRGSKTDESGKELDEIIKPENLAYAKPRLMNDSYMHYCPGCSHGVIHKLLAETIEEMGMEERTIGVSPVGCAVFAYNYIDIDWIEAAHGRAPAVATALKRLNKDKMIFTYQGDGDLAAIGTAETIHAANRGENIVIVFVNNAIYGMTGGQMASTTLEGMETTTCPYGRNVELNGYPLKISDLLAKLEGVCLVTRQSVHTAPAVRKAKKMLRKAFENSMAGKGTSVVEIVSTCSSGWKMTPEQANKWMETKMFPFYPPGDLKNE
jgi:2-oxoglutarate ferredoxin oxidoreductase subunit beta